MSEKNQQNKVLSTVGDFNDIAAKGPVGALLTPIATVFGQAIGAYGEEVLRRRQSNLNAHTHAVLGDTIPDDLDGASALDLFTWAEEAQNVPVSDIELSAKVRAALKSKLDDESSVADAIMKLNRDEIIALTTNQAIPKEATFLLSSKGLVEQRALWRSLFRAYKTRKVNSIGSSEYINIAQVAFSFVAMLLCISTFLVFSHRFTGAIQSFVEYQSEIFTLEELSSEILDLRASVSSIEENSTVVESQENTPEETISTDRSTSEIQFKHPNAVGLLGLLDQKEAQLKSSLEAAKSKKTLYESNKPWAVGLLVLLSVGGLSYSFYALSVLRMGWYLNERGVKVRNRLRKYLGN